MRMFLIYPEGNFIEASADTPFMQIGETKYGRPILLRAYDSSMSFEDAVKLLLVSFDSTIKANLSVGAPLDVSYYETDSLAAQPILRIDGSDEYFSSISESWGDVTTCLPISTMLSCVACQKHRQGLTPFMGTSIRPVRLGHSQLLTLTTGSSPMPTGL